MAYFTQSIRNVLIEQADKDGKDISTVDGIYDSAMASIFTGEGINAISSEYRKNFVTSFSLHYFNYEIGLETMNLFKMKLFEKLYNNGSYINEIYNALDKQLFANYRVHKVDNTSQATIDVSRETSDTTSSSSESTNSNTNVVDGESKQEGSASESASASDSGDSTKNGTATHTGTSENASEGSDVITDNTSNSTSGSDVVSDSSATTTSGSDVTTSESEGENSKTTVNDAVKTDEYGHRIDDDHTTEYNGKEIDTADHDIHHYQQGTYDDEVVFERLQADVANNEQFFSDTPQGQLSMANIKNGNYMTNATVAKSTAEAGFKTKETTTHDYTDGNGLDNYDDGKIENTKEFDQRNDAVSGYTEHSGSDTHNENSNSTESGSENSSTSENKTYDSTESKSGEVTTEYGKVETKDGETVTTYGKTDTRTDNLEDASNETESHSNMSESEKSSSNSLTSTNDVTTTDEGSSSTSGETSHDGTESSNTVNTAEGSVDEMSYEMNWEMLYQSMPLLNKVWTIFDDLFMGLWC